MTEKKEEVPNKKEVEAPKKPVSEASLFYKNVSRQPVIFRDSESRKYMFAAGKKFRFQGKSTQLEQLITDGKVRRVP